MEKLTHILLFDVLFYNLDACSTEIESRIPWMVRNHRAIPLAHAWYLVLIRPCIYSIEKNQWKVCYTINYVSPIHRKTILFQFLKQFRLILKTIYAVYLNTWILGMIPNILFIFLTQWSVRQTWFYTTFTLLEVEKQINKATRPKPRSCELLWNKTPFSIIACWLPNIYS